jgi:hypothetical protein
VHQEKDLTRPQRLGKPPFGLEPGVGRPFFDASSKFQDGHCKSQERQTPFHGGNAAVPQSALRVRSIDDRCTGGVVLVSIGIERRGVGSTVCAFAPR